MDLMIEEIPNQEPQEYTQLDFDDSDCYRRLGIAVLIQAAKDAAGVGRYSQESIQNEAQQWLLNHGETWAVGLGINIDQIQILDYLKKPKRKEMFYKNKHLD